MNYVLRKVMRWFFNTMYTVKPPEQVSYYKSKEQVQAKVVQTESGAMEMEIQGEKYNYPGFPRGHVLVGPLAKMKNKIKNSLFNQVFAEIESMTKDMKYDMLPPEKMSPAVRELYRVLEALENAEVVPDMKGRIALIRKVLCFFLQEDDAYRFRYQWVMERLDMNKVKLTKADLYYFRGKYFKVDHDKFDY